MAMFIGQLSGRKSLRDLVMNVTAQTSKLYTWPSSPALGQPWPEDERTTAHLSSPTPANPAVKVMYSLYAVRV